MIRTKGEPDRECGGSSQTYEDSVRRNKKTGYFAEGRADDCGKGDGAPYDLVVYVAENGRLPVVNFAAGGIATPADAALMMQLGVDGVFVGSGIFKSSNPKDRAKAIVLATTNYNDPEFLAEISRDLGEAMPGLEISNIAENERMQDRGW
jgi:pyridoxal 5'-phosphate synthase pdxS subunit